MDFTKHKLSVRVKSAVTELSKKEKCAALIKVELKMIWIYLEALQ